MNTPDADGWVTESSEGTPTQPEVAVAESATPDTAIDPSEIDSETQDEQEARIRDEQGRFAPKTSDEPAKDAPVEPEKPPSKRSPDGRKLTLRQEIDALTRQKHEEAREVERLRSERQRYTSPDPTPAPAAKSYGFPSLDEWQASNPTHPDPFDGYYTAKAEYVADQRFQQHQAQYEQATRAQTFVERGKSVYTDWDDTFASVADIRISPQLGQVLLADPDGHRLAYELAKHPDQHGAVLDAQDALSLGVALGTLKARLSGAPSAPSAQSVHSAPPPIQPVGSSPVSQTVNVDDLPFGPEYMRRANEQDKKRGRPW
jgi:hypothetical protein